MSKEGFQVAALFVRRSGDIMARPCEGSVKVVVRQLDARWHRPQQSLRLFCGFNGRLMGPSIEPTPQFANPIPAGGVRKMRVSFQVAFKPNFAELVVIKGAELSGQTSQHSDESELAGYPVDHKTEPCITG